MVFYEVFSHPRLKRYKTNIFSKASIVQLISFTLTALSPFLIAYFTGNFWIRQDLYNEQPVIAYQYRFIAILESGTTTYLATSYESVNEIFSSNYRPFVVNVQELDTNNDLYNNVLNFNLFISGISPTDQILNAKLLLLFNCSLSVKSIVNFESIGYFEASNSQAATGINFQGQLNFFQTVIFQEKQSYNDYNYLYLNQTNLDLQSLNLNNIVGNYTSRNYGTKLVTDFVSWTNPVAYGFSIIGAVRYPTFQVVYVPWFWEQFKYGWIQYVAILIPIYYIFSVIKIFIFENQIVATIVPSEKTKTA